MSVELIIAPPATGKTDACLQRIREVQKAHPLSPTWVIVPDRLQAAAFRRRLAAAGGAMGVQVGRFTDLFKHILENEGTFQPAASAPLLHRLIQETVDCAVEANAIPYYQPLQLFPGFIIALRDAFAELKRALVSPGQFTDYARTGNAAQKDLAVLYERYQARLTDLGWTDPEEITWQAVKALEQKPASCAAIQLVIVDGFDSFNGSQYRVLQLLSGQVGDLVITFPGMRNSVRSAHRRFTDSIERLITDLSPKITSLENSPHLPPVVDYLEKRLFEPMPDEKKLTDQPFLLEARSPADEAREALRWIKKLVVRNNIPLNACVLFTPNAEIYHPLLRLAASEFGIPIRFTLDDALESSPAINALSNLLSLPQRNFASRYLINALRSPYFEFAVDGDMVNTFEMVSRVGQVVEGRDQWEEVWERLAASSDQEKQDLDDERNSPRLPRGTEAEQLCRSLRAVFDLITPPAETRNLTGWITWLEDLLERLRFYENAQSEQDQTACETFREVLRALVISEAVAGHREVDYVQFLTDLQSAVAGERYRESASFGKPALLVGRMTEARGTRFKAVVLLGLSEGSFPANERPDPFLPEELRSDLGLELRLDREQAGLFYQAITRTNAHLLLTRPYLSDDGEEWEESAFWKAAASLLDKTAVTRVRPDSSQPLTEAASTQELLFSSVRRQELPKAYAFLAPRWQELQHANQVLKARRAKKADGPYEGLAEALVPVVNERYSPARVWSPSRLESYSTCPFKFYISNALEVEAHDFPELGLDAAQMGSMFHKILELTYRNAQDPIDLQSLLNSLQNEARKVFATAPKEFGFRPSNLWEVEKVQWLEKLAETVTALSADSSWRPYAFEARYGLDGRPPLNINLGEEVMQVHGIIDRVDKNASGQLRVIDYKTGGQMNKRDLEKGYRLQLPIYALAARDALHLGLPVDGFYWRILAADPSSLKLASFSTGDEKGIEVAIQVAIAHLIRIVHGIRAAEFQPKKPDGGCPSYCPAAAWCWRYEPGW